ncbi:MAG: [ribosomal protein S18]-alanine N-acetyltransferase, partial [Euryarchaeota archaeon]|nr:[ribosomal protein S18]-alanine N-acetyltransferase [Euryarchaeota archaeon]
QRMIVAERAGEVVGVAAALDNKIDLLWVHPSHHRNGIGGALLDIVEAEIAKSGCGIGTLECFSDNDRALGFYRSKGWQPLLQEMDDEAGAMKMVMTKALVQPNSERS